MGMTGFGRTAQAVLRLTLVLTLASLLAPAPRAAASTAPDAGVEGDDQVELLPGTIPMPPAAEAAPEAWSFPGTEAIYYMRKGREDWIDNGLSRDQPPYSLVAIDPSDGTTLAAAAPVPSLLYANTSTGSIAHHVVASADGERLYAAYGRWGHTQGQLQANASSGVSDAASLCTSGTGLRGQVVFASNQCFGGLHVLNATTMEVESRIDFQPVNLDGSNITPLLRAMTYEDGHESSGDKILALIDDWNSALPQAGNNVDGAVNPRYKGFAVTYAVQFDVATGRQEWMVRLDACRGSRERDDTGQAAVQRTMPRPGAVFRVMDTPSPALYAACFAPNQTGTVVRVPLAPDGMPYALPVSIGQPQPEEAPSSETPNGAVAASPAIAAVFGPERTVSMLADAPSGRIAMKVFDKEAEVWWIFDTTRMRFAGTVGVGGGFSGGHRGQKTSATLDDRGRLYVAAPATSSFSGGLLIADIRRNPLPQALVFPQFKQSVYAGANSAQFVPFTRVAASGARLLYLRAEGEDFLRVIEDRLPMGEEDADPTGGYAGRTLDLDEAEGVTSSVLDGAARGFGARVILMAGASGLARVGPVDPLGQVLAQGQQGSAADLQFDSLGIDNPVPAGNGCAEDNRELVIGMVGPDSPMVVDSTGSRAAARAVLADSITRADTETPVSRCSQSDWDALWSTALFGRAPAPEPNPPWLLGEDSAECLSTADDASDSAGDPMFQRFSAVASCSGTESSGAAYFRGFDLEGVRIGEVISSGRVYRDPARGVVSRVESVTRSIGVDGVLQIALVRGVAESWANGRRQPVADAEREPGYDPNCDMERTAGTCFQRHLFGVRTPGYSCGPCGDEQRLLEAMNRALGANGVAGFREPDEQLARGAENGFIAAIQKPSGARFADLTLNNDLLQTVLPSLELIRYAAPARLGGGGPRGRQIYQFAGVEVSSSYGIACLLVYDEAANTCAEQAEAPGSIQVSLSDTDGKPLAGGAFEVRADVDADGVLGLKDTLLPDGACVTAEDGVGTCMFENLQPGTYLVSQVAAPPGYAKTAEPWVSEVASGEQRTVVFTNVSNVSTIDLTATDENGAPLSGAVFAAYADPDSDGKVAPDAQPAAECTTDAQGVCTMKVPAGSYVLVQTSAPGGLEGIEPVPFTFASGGQVASVSVVNYPPASPSQPDAPASPVYTPPVDQSPPREFIDPYVAPSVDVIEPDIAPGPSVTERVGGTVTQVIRAPGDALRLLARDPKQAVAWTAALALFLLAAMAVRRRQAAVALIQQ